MTDPFMGQVNMIAFSYAPRGWAYCDGQLLPISQNQALYAIMGTAFGGDGRTTFGLPDLRGRVPIHEGSAPGRSTYQRGWAGGFEQVQIATANMPAHTHAVNNQLEVAIAAVDSNADSINPGPTTSLGIGNKPAGMAAEQVKNYSTATPDTTINGGALSGNLTIGSTGGGVGLENRQPYQTLGFVIALQGQFPPRN